MYISHSPEPFRGAHTFSMSNKLNCDEDVATSITLA